LTRSTTRAALTAVFALAGCALALAGCANKTTAPIGNGDVGGTHLIAFASDRGQSSGLTSIYLWDTDQLTFRDVTGLNGSLEPRNHPSISPDGRFIAYEVSRNGNWDIEVYDRRVQRTDDNASAAINTGDDEREPTFTGDGHLLAFTQGRTAKRIRLFDGPNTRFIALPGLDTLSTAYSDWAPAPNYDGSIIAFVSDRRGNPDIFLYDRNRHVLLDGPNVRNALVSGGADVDPRFSTHSWYSGGGFLAFASDRGGTYDLYRLEFHRTQSTTDTLFTALTGANSASTERHPAIDDGGNFVVFESNRPGQGRTDLWQLDVNGGTVTQPGVARGFATPADELEPSIKWGNF
jgi:Tol biopolymer transport system component